MDWYTADKVTSEHARHLTELDHIRTNFPILWALIQGLQTSESIAKHILWPHHWVLGTLRQYKRDGMVWDSEGKASVIWHLTPDAVVEQQLKRWVASQKQSSGIFRRNEQAQE